MAAMKPDCLNALFEILKGDGIPECSFYGWISLVIVCWASRSWPEHVNLSAASIGVSRATADDG